MLDKVIKGLVSKPFRIVVYGVEGIGKSTFAAQAPNPIFLCAEDGACHLDIARFPSPKSWADVLETVRVLTSEEHDFRTLVIDTIDWLEPLCWSQVCAAGGKQSIEDFGYGKGYVMALELWRQLLSRLEALERTRKLNVVLVAHATIRRVEDPYAGAFDRYRLKLHEKTADLVKEWCDAVLFARHEIFDKKNGQSVRKIAGDRVLHTQWTAAFDAKNRFGLPDTIRLDWKTFEEFSKKEALEHEIRHLTDRHQEVLAWCDGDVDKLTKSINKLKNKEVSK